MCACEACTHGNRGHGSRRVIMQSCKKVKSSTKKDKGIKTAYLKWTPDGRVHDKWWERRYPTARRFISGDRYVTGKLFQIIYGLEKTSCHITPLSMNTKEKKFTRGMLLQNCKENNLVGMDEKGFSRKTLISKLMSI